MAKTKISNEDKESLDALIRDYQQNGVLVLQSILDHKLVRISVNRIIGKYNVPTLGGEDFWAELQWTVCQAVETYSRKEQICKFHTYLYRALYYSTCTILKKYEFSREKEYLKDNNLEMEDIGQDCHAYLQDSRKTLTELASQDQDYEALVKSIKLLMPDIKAGYINAYVNCRVNDVAVGLCAKQAKVKTQTLNLMMADIDKRLRDHYGSQEI